MDQSGPLGAWPMEQVSTASQADYEQVRALLSSWSLGSYLRTKPPSSVVTLTQSMTVGQAMKVLATHRILSAPLLDDSGNDYCGFVDMDGILAALLALADVRSMTEETREYRLRSCGLCLETQQLRNLQPGSDGTLIYKAELQSSLLDVIMYGFLQPLQQESHVCHRVAVFELTDAYADMDEDDVQADERLTGADSHEQEGSDQGMSQPAVRGIRITSIVSQSDMVCFLHRRQEALGPLASRTLSQLGLAYKPVVCVPAEMSTINAYAAMAANNVSSVGIVSHSADCPGGLAGSLGSSDLRGVLPQHFTLLAMPVLQFVSLQPSTAGWQQRGGTNEWGLKGSEALKPPRVVCCTPASTLSQVLALLVTEHVHRLYVVDERRRPVGILTITDLLRALVGWAPETEEEAEAMAAENGEALLEEELLGADLGVGREVMGGGVNGNMGSAGSSGDLGLVAVAAAQQAVPLAAADAGVLEQEGMLVRAALITSG